MGRCCYQYNFGTNAKKFIKCLCIHTTEQEKYIFRPVMTTTASRYSKESCLFYICNSCHRYEFLVDTDAVISVITPTPVLYKLKTTNGPKINTYSGKSFTLTKFFMDFYTKQAWDTLTRSRLPHTFQLICEHGYQDTGRQWNTTKNMRSSYSLYL